jgi:aminomethyltransferase
MTPDRRPFLYDVHVADGAKMVPFGGWSMPLHYGDGTLAEHLACRRDAVVFDVSHLGTVRVVGDHLATLQRVLSNDLRKIEPGRAQYTHLLNERGGVEDDIIVWWVAEHEFDVMPNASNTSRVLASLPGIDVTDTRSVLAVQGPRARERLASVAPELAAIGRFRVRTTTYDGYEVRVAGTGYTGEDGVEIAAPPDVAEKLWRSLLGAGIVPAGLGARDTLRLEAALPLHGHDLSPEISPIEAGLAWVIGWKKAEFVGRDALAAQRDGAPHRWVAAIATTSRQPLREGAEVVVHGQRAGVLTSGNYSPIRECGIGLGLVNAPTEVGEPVTVVLRGREVAAFVVAPPFVAKAT